MTLVLGLFLIPLSIYSIIKLNSFKVTKKEKIIHNLLMILVPFLYLVICFLLEMEPFVFEIDRAADYLVFSLVIFIFTPFMWINLFYYCGRFFKRLKANKNFKIKSREQCFYYRDDLNKVSPSTVMFVSNLELDPRTSITASIMKLKITGFIKEENGKIVKTNKNDTSLLASERMLLKSLRFKDVDTKEYTDLVEREVKENGYIRKNRGNRLIKLVKMLVTIAIPVLLVMSSIQFDTYVYDNYKTYIYEGKRYVLVEDDIGDIGYGTIPDIDDYYHGIVYGDVFYDKALIRADKYDNEYVLKTEVMQLLDVSLIVVSILSCAVFLFLLIEQLIYFNKGYIRTAKGTKLLTEAYGLKNYLKDFSIMKKRTEKELVLWEYYLVYAVALGVNTKVDDELIDKYFK